jgi:hypothetical protein
VSGPDPGKSVTRPNFFGWPAELDLMARLAGSHLRDRWVDCPRPPFTAERTAHVSVWGKP